MHAEARASMTTNRLHSALTDYIDDNRHSRDVNERWLCALLGPYLETIAQVRNSRIDEENKLAVNSFRASEIEKELQTKRRETEVLERDLAVLRSRAAD